jgi:glutamine cyclotransferase
MKKFLWLPLLLGVAACSNESATTQSAASFLVLKQGNQASVTIENVPAEKTSLYINGQKFEGWNKSLTQSIAASHLQPGQNYFKLVVEGSNDTLSDELFFSYNISYQLVQEYPHDTEHFTQGLLFNDGILYESTGLEGKSGIWKYKVNNTGFTEIGSVKNDPAIFGEGIAIVGNQLYQLSWKNKKVLRYNKSNLKKEQEFDYPEEGWGLCNYGDTLIASDGSEQLHFIDPKQFNIVRSIQVKGEQGPLRELNELELVQDIIIANVWQTHTLAFIDLHSGHVLGTADLTALYQSARQQYSQIDVLNGVAYDPKDGTLLVTGKNWPKMYRIRLDEQFQRLLKRSGEI